MSNAADRQGASSDVVIVAGSTAYPEYLEYQAYVGHSNRPFRKTAQRMAFYKSQVIQREVPEILDIRHGIAFSDATVSELYSTGRPDDRDIADLIQVLLEETGRGDGELFDVVLLSAPDDPKTFMLPQAVKNTKKNRRGNPAPITMGQYRYASMSALERHPATTEELDL